MKLLQIPIAAICYCCVATVLAEAALLSAIWARGGLSEEKVVQVLAVSKDVDLQAMRKKIEMDRRPIEVEQISFADIVSLRKLTSLNLDLREIALDKGLIDVRQLEFMLESERTQYDGLKATFDKQLQTLRLGETDPAMQELQRQIESISPRLAKEQIIMILEDGKLDPDVALRFVIATFKNMPLDKRKKLVAEFKTDEDNKHLHHIMTQIRLGVPEVDLIRQTRRDLDDVNSETGR